jgi:hypothetical protein
MRRMRKIMIDWRAGKGKSEFNEFRGFQTGGAKKRIKT